MSSGSRPNPYRDAEDDRRASRRPSRLAALASHAPELVAVGLALGLVAYLFGVPTSIAMTILVVAAVAAASLPYAAARRLARNPDLVDEADVETSQRQVQTLGLGLLAWLLVVTPFVALMVGLAGGGTCIAEHIWSYKAAEKAAC